MSFTGPPSARGLGSAVRCRWVSCGLRLDDDDRGQLLGWRLVRVLLVGRLTRPGAPVRRAVGPRRDRGLAAVAKLARRVPQRCLVAAVDQTVDRSVGRLAVE